MESPESAQSWESNDVIYIAKTWFALEVEKPFMIP